MPKKHHYFLSLIIIALLSLPGLVSFALNKLDSKNSAPLQTPMIFFYADGCPHCITVENFMQTNSITNYIALEKREVRTAANNKLLAETLQKCHITAKEIELPVLWSGSECLLGEENIINFFKKELSCQKANKRF